MIFRWPWKRPTPDHQDFLTELARSHPGRGMYDKIDRYRDFRRVFLDTEQGRRVLYELLTFCGMYKSAAPAANFDPYETMFLNGRQDIAFGLLGIINKEPKDRPKSTKEK